MAHFYRRWGKSLLDRTAAAVGLVVLAPALAGLAGVIRWRLGSPVLFRQTRPGLHGRPFEMVKFRTMTDARGADGRPLPDADLASYLELPSALPLTLCSRCPSTK